jgi:hypothetical protein
MGLQPARVKITWQKDSHHEIIASKVFRAKLEPMSLSRVVLTSNIMGRPIGIPGDVDGQNKVLQAALDLLDSASALNTIVAL